MRRAALLGAVLVVSVGTVLGAGVAQAVPLTSHLDLAQTVRCDTADPLNGPRKPVYVDVYDHVQVPSDGLRGPAITLTASDRARPGLLEYTTDVRVSWTNLATHRTGVVRVPGRAPRITWQVDLHPGAGPVAFTVDQTVGALLFVPMVNAKHTTCRGSAVA